MVNNFTSFLTINLYFVLLFVFSVFIFNYVKVDTSREKPRNYYEILRKSIHILVVLVFIMANLLLSKILFDIVCIEFLIALPIISRLPLPKPVKNASDFKKNLGVYGIPIGLLLINTFSSKANINASLLILLISDTAAALVGTYYPIRQYKVFGNKKSISGTFSFLLTSLLILFIFSNLSFVGVIVIAFALTIIENYSGFGLDNIFILVFSSIFLYINLFLSIFICILYLASFVVVNKFYANNLNNNKR